jgi:DNA-directed RNA polymerase specialized sigma24 family protein
MPGVDDVGPAEVRVAFRGALAALSPRERAVVVPRYYPTCRKSTQQQRWALRRAA